MSNSQIFSSLGYKQLHILRDRAQMFKRARAFFDERGILEVDCPALSPRAPVDVHIDVMKVSLFETCVGFLHTSPEYGMKRLLSEGLGDIYQLSHVFRDNEWGKQHNPEFTMVEWYRCDISFDAMIEETCAFLRLFLGDRPVETLSYHDAFLQYLGINPLTATVQELQACLQACDAGVKEKDRDILLQLCMQHCIEPKLDKEILSVITHFPASQAALARTLETREGERVAARFEVFYGGLELANGYHELADGEELLARFEEANRARKEQGKDSLPIDYAFLDAMGKGLPDCCGVAVGFDRLMLLRHGCKALEEVIPFAWDGDEAIRLRDVACP